MQKRVNLLPVNRTKTGRCGTVFSGKTAACAPLKVHRPILRKTWLGLEDELKFQLKYSCVSLHCFGQFFKRRREYWPKQWRETHDFFTWNYSSSSRLSHVFRSMGRWTFSGAQNQNILVETDRLPSLQMHLFRKRTKNACPSEIDTATFLQKKMKFCFFRNLTDRSARTWNLACLDTFQC